MGQTITWEEKKRESEAALGSWGISHWWLLHGCTYYTFTSATVVSLSRLKSAAKVSNMSNMPTDGSLHWCLNSATLWSKYLSHPLLQTNPFCPTTQSNCKLVCLVFFYVKLHSLLNTEWENMLCWICRMQAGKLSRRFWPMRRQLLQWNCCSEIVKTEDSIVSL